MQRPYPAMAVEIQDALGAGGFAFDMNVACSSATFALEMAVNAVRSGTARAALVVDPEICSAHLAWRDRDCHFIFGDVCTALVVQRASEAKSSNRWEVLGTKLATRFSNNIRNNAGFLSRCEDRDPGDRDQLFRQEGRKVFKEVCPMAADHIAGHLQSLGHAPADVRRFWLHQANLAMNQLIGKRLLGHEASADEAPIILDEFANTASAGSIIAFHRHNADLATGDLGVICSFGAGYSIGSLVVRKVS
jgi:beta-ketodecanoyl-[acyl-carrier-protein] synthase